MSEDTATINADEATSSEEAVEAPANTATVGGLTVRITPRVVVASIVVLALCVATAVGLVASKRNKDDERASSGKAKNETAAVVDDIRVTTTELDAILASWLKSADFVKGQPAPIVVDGKPTAAFRADILTSEIQNRLVNREFTKRKLKISDEYAQSLRQQLDQDPISKQLDPAFIAAFIDGRARQESLRVALAKQPTEAEITAAYKQQFSCASGIQVGHILVKTEAEAAAIVGQLGDGGDFAAIASEKSTDTGSAAKGGDLGCFAKGTFVAPFEQATIAAIPGTPTAPVKSEFGFHVIKTEQFAAPPLATVRAQIVQALTQQDTSFAEYFKALLAKTKVTISPAIGTWKIGANGFYAVVPPEAAPGTTTPNLNP